MSDETYRFSYIGPTAVDPRHAEMERLKAENDELLRERLMNLRFDLWFSMLKPRLIDAKDKEDKS